MEMVRTYIQACIKILNRVLDASARKLSRVILVYGFTRLVRRGDKPNKETHIDMPYISCYYCPSRHNLIFPKQIKHCQTLNHTGGHLCREVIP